MTATIKTYRVWTHQEVSPIEVEASSRKEAIKIALDQVELNPPIIPSRDVEAWYHDANGRPVETHIWPSRVPKKLEKPLASVKPKDTNRFRRY